MNWQYKGCIIASTVKQRGEFSLEAFFEQLITMLENSAKYEAGDSANDLRNIQSFVEDEYRYAKECVDA